MSKRKFVELPEFGYAVDVKGMKFALSLPDEVLALMIAASPFDVDIEAVRAVGQWWIDKAEEKIR